MRTSQSELKPGIPEDDPRNPACIADNVGDNVGDVAGMGAVYTKDPYVGSIISCAALAATATGLDSDVLVPMLYCGCRNYIIYRQNIFFCKHKRKMPTRKCFSAL